MPGPEVDPFEQQSEEEYWRQLCEANPYPPVLDACCGSRMFWFNKKDSRAIYHDKRRETHVLDSRPGRNQTVIDPDILGDFTSLQFPDNTFHHVVFDPPHTVTNSTAGWKRTKYGSLCDGWRDMLRKGFAECFRVLKPGGTLIFKWAESSVPLSEILKLTKEKPLYGHKSGKQQLTHWVAFIKTEASPVLGEEPPAEEQGAEPVQTHNTGNTPCPHYLSLADCIWQGVGSNNGITCSDAGPCVRTQRIA